MTRITAGLQRQVRINHCQKTEWKNRAQDPEHRSEQRHFNLQPKPAKILQHADSKQSKQKGSRASEKAQTVINRGTQIGQTTFINKIHSETRITQSKDQANFNFKNPHFQEYSRLSIRAGREWLAAVQWSNPRIQDCIRDCLEQQLTNM